MLLHDTALTLNLKKLEFFTNRIEYIGHVIYPSRLELLERMIDASDRIQYPKTETELLSLWVSVANYPL